MTDKMRGIVARADGGVTVHLSARERDLLRSLPGQLRPLLAGEAEAPTVSSRLFSRGYEDNELEAEYHSLVAEDVVSQRLAAMDAFAVTLEEGSQRGGRWRTELDAEAATAWLSAINDGRLILGALLGVTDESAWEQHADDENPTSIVLYYLGWLQEELVAALTTALPED
ncbi:MAG: DUF2017 family protein [Nitriliruptorales bacterium]|nr:DUF2017 family protein [Nitriliruptorales bacterium]